MAMLVITRGYLHFPHDFIAMKSPPEIFHGVVIQLSMGFYLNIQPEATTLWQPGWGMGQNMAFWGWAKMAKTYGNYHIWRNKHPLTSDYRVEGFGLIAIL